MYICEYTLQSFSSAKLQAHWALAVIRLYDNPGLFPFLAAARVRLKKAITF